MMQKRTFKRFTLSLLVGVLLQAVLFCGPASAVPLHSEPDFGDESMRQLLEQGLYREARDMAQAMLDESPDNAGALAILGYAQASLGQWEVARQNILRAIERVPAERRDDLRILLADIMARSGDVAEAERLLQDIVARDPQNSRALLGLGFLYRLSGDIPQATHYLNETLKLDRWQDTALRALLEIYLAQNDFAAIVRVAQDIPATSASKGLGFYFEALALIRQDEPDHETAIDLLQKSLNISRPTPQGHFMLGYVLLKEQRAPEAAQQLSRAVALDPDFFDAQRLLGMVLIDLNRPQVATQHLRRALAIKESPELRNTLAQAYMMQGNGKQGLAELMKSLENTDQTSDDRASLQGLQQYTAGKYEQSEQSLRQALVKTPDVAQLRFLLISSLLKQQRFEAAAREARLALTLHPDEGVLLLNLLALARLGSGAFDDAEASLRQALLRDPSSETTHINISTVYFRTGQYAKAEQALNTILAFDPDDQQIKIRLARVYQAADDFAAAERVLLGPDGDAPTAGVLMREIIHLKSREKKYDEALEHALAMVGRYPRLYEGYALEAQALASMGRSADAIAALETGFNQAGESQGALAVAASIARVYGWHENAVRYLRRHNAQFGLDDPILKKLFAVELIEIGETEEARKIVQSGLGATDPDALYLLAKSHLADGDQVSAEQYIDAALEAGVAEDVVERQRAELRIAIGIGDLKKNLLADPDDARLYRALAAAYEFVGDFDAAIAVYQDGIAKFGDDPSLQTQIARLLFKNGDAEQAIEVANQVLNDTGVEEVIRIQANAVLGMAWARQRDTDKAEQALTLATVAGSRIAPAFFELAKIKSARGDIAAAQALLRSAIEIEPGSLDYYLGLATLYQRSGKISEAIAVYEDGLAKNPGSVPLLNNVALVYLRQGANETALARAHEALELAPEDANVLDTLGWLHVQIEDAENAIPFLERAVDRDPAYSLYRYHLGVGYFEVGSMDLAKAELEEALNRQNNAPWAPEIRRVLAAIQEP